MDVHTKQEKKYIPTQSITYIYIILISSHFISMQSINFIYQVKLKKKSILIRNCLFTATLDVPYLFHVL